jgi:quercetin dioxygenase-like cupin family protein
MRQCVAVGVVVGVVGIAALLWAQGEQTKLTPKLEGVQSIIERVKLENPNVPVRNFAQGEHATVNVVTPTAPLRAHYHNAHEEIVYIIRGHGKMRLGEEVKPAKAGDVMFIPKKTVHGFVPESDDCIALSIFAPAFDGKDRVPVEEK